MLALDIHLDQYFKYPLHFFPIQSPFCGHVRYPFQNNFILLNIIYRFSFCLFGIKHILCKSSSLFDKMSDEAMRSFGLGPKFVSGQTLAFLVAGCLALYILISLIGAVVDASQVVRFTNATAVLSSPTSEVIAGEALTLLIRLSLIGVALLTAVAFLFWIYRAHKNLKALGATDLKFSPGWAIGGFFVPILNIVRPYQVVTEIWKASAAGARRSATLNWTYEQTPLFISLWWGSWLISRFMDSLSVFVVFGAGERDQLLVASRYRLVYDVISIAAAALAMTVVLAINARQERSNRSNSSRGSAPEPDIERYQL